MDISALRMEAIAIAIQASAQGLTQTRIAETLGASQPQVSRLLRGHMSRRSRLFREICIYVRSAANGVDATAVCENAELIDALTATWDGTARHAAALAAVIRGLGALNHNSRSLTIQGKMKC